MNKNIFPKASGLEYEKAELCLFLQPVGLRAWSFKGQQVWLG